jgi:hypothetical protein
MKELGLVATDREMRSGRYLLALGDALEGMESPDARKMRRLIAKDPGCFRAWSSKGYLGCCQEPMNSHYYAPRLAKLPGGGFGRGNADKVLQISLAERNGARIRLGFEEELHWLPDIGPNPLGDWMCRQRYDIDKSQYQEWQRRLLTAIEYGEREVL